MTCESVRGPAEARPEKPNVQSTVNHHHTATPCCSPHLCTVLVLTGCLMLDVSIDPHEKVC